MYLEDGKFHHSTYVTAHAKGTGVFSTSHPDANLTGWPNSNAVWSNVHTIRFTKNALKVKGSGEVVVLGN